MIYHLLDWLEANKVGLYAYEDVLFRAVLAALTSWAICMMAGPRIIRWLMRKKIGDRPEFFHTALNELMKERANTPTMGGVLILSAVIGATLLWANLRNPFVFKALFVVVWYGAIGLVDDWLKLTAKSHQRTRDGLRAWEKLAFQFGGAVLVAFFLYRSDFANIPDATRFWLPFYKYGIPLAGSVFAIITILYISATSNAVNLTDGMDGLASGCIGIVSSVLILLCYVASERMSYTQSNLYPEGISWASYLLLPHIPGAGELCIFFAAITGAMLGFLWFNWHPAQVFMGDTGSLPLGAAMGYGAIVTRHEILLLVIGGVFMMELFSVIIQVGYFKYTGGKRIFRCAPIHHHFHLAGWGETQVVVRFWLLGIAFAALALATLKLR